MKKITNKTYKKSKKRFGGKAIDAGSYGCVFKPPIKCANPPPVPYDSKTISKLMYSEETEAELIEMAKVKKFISTIPDKENYLNTFKIASRLKNFYLLGQKINMSETKILGFNKDKWYGCFGVQSYINRNFLIHINNKYNITNLINVVQNRADRCCLERLFGILFFQENKSSKKIKSLFGNIHEYQNFGY